MTSNHNTRSRSDLLKTNIRVSPFMFVSCCEGTHVLAPICNSRDSTEAVSTSFFLGQIIRRNWLFTAAWAGTIRWVFWRYQNFSETLYHYYNNVSKCIRYIRFSRRLKALFHNENILMKILFRGNIYPPKKFLKIFSLRFKKICSFCLFSVSWKYSFCIVCKKICQYITIAKHFSRNIFTKQFHENIFTVEQGLYTILATVEQAALSIPACMVLVSMAQKAQKNTDKMTKILINAYFKLWKPHSIKMH